ncbi:MAG: FAD-binding oxidoreductase [Anaerolineae bacterium]|nr:MAG: FAD-binding oxidoreductase [Anaerolineae bacterium]
MKLTPLWTDLTPRPADLPAHDQPEEVDVAIIGSGYTGLHAARVVADAGAKVAVLEREHIGFGASSRNGGMLTSGLKASPEIIEKRYGLDKARQFWQWSLDSIDLVDRVIRDEGIDCGWARRGHLSLAYKPAHFDHFRKHVDYLKNKYGYTGYTLVSRADLKNEIGTQEYYGGKTAETTGGLDPARYVFGLARAVAKRGVSLVENAGVTRIRREDGAFRLTTPRGETRAREVLLATNGYTTPDVAPKARSGIMPIGSYIISTEPLPEALQKELSPNGRMFYDSKQYLNYFRLSPDGRMVFGGRNNLSTSLDLEESARRLHQRMLTVYPQLEGVSLTHSWTGKLGVTYDLMPHIGRENGMWFAYGYGGHGVSIASFLGYEMGRILTGQQSGSLFQEIPHPRFFFTRWDKLFLPIVAQYYRLVDALT